MAITGETSACTHDQYRPHVHRAGRRPLHRLAPTATTPRPGRDNRSLVLLAKSVDGGNTFPPPVKVADLYDLPDCAVYQQGKGSDVPACRRRAPPPTPSSGPSTTRRRARSDRPKQDRGRVRLVHQPQLQRGQRLRPDRVLPIRLNLYTGVKAPGTCSNDILISSPPTRARRSPGGRRTPRVLPVVTTEPAQATPTSGGSGPPSPRRQARGLLLRPAVRLDETTGFSDVSLSGSKDLVTSGSSG